MKMALNGEQPKLQELIAVKTIFEKILSPLSFASVTFKDSCFRFSYVVELTNS